MTLINSNFREYLFFFTIKVAKLIQGLIQRVVWSALDATEAFLGRREPLTPPRHLINVGSNKFTRNDFNQIGQELFRYLVDIGGLKPNDKVLDVGCGVGRMAIPLTRYLSAQGTYNGFDIVAESIQYCMHTISPQFASFHFHHADIFNTHYNPGGKYFAHQYKFPFPDETFSFVFLTSVFTHMQAKEVSNYLNEIQRVLSLNGRAFVTYFLLNLESEKLMRTNKISLNFAFPIEHGKVTQINVPEAAVAFDESYIREIYQESGLRIIEPIHYGSWCKRKTEVGYQDIIVGVK